MTPLTEIKSFNTDNQISLKRVIATASDENQHWAVFVILPNSEMAEYVMTCKGRDSTEQVVLAVDRAVAAVLGE